MTEELNDTLTHQDYHDIWYLIDYYGNHMWNSEKVERMRSLIKNAEKSLIE